MERLTDMHAHWMAAHVGAWLPPDDPNPPAERVTLEHRAGEPFADKAVGPQHTSEPSTILEDLCRAARLCTTYKGTA